MKTSWQTFGSACLVIATLIDALPVSRCAIADGGEKEIAGRSVAQAVDSKLPLEARLEAWHDIASIDDPSLRQTALQLVSERSDLAIAAYALPAYIAGGGIPDADMVQKVKRMSWGDQLGVLGAVLCAGWFQNSDEMAATARLLLNDANAQDPRVLSSAALIVGHARNAKDRDMLVKMAKTHPENVGVWIGLAELMDGDIPADVQDVARLVVKRDDVDVLVRVAAASALPSSDPDGGQLVKGVLKAFLDKFSNLDWEEMGAQMLNNDVTATERWHQFSTQAPALSVLRVLDKKLAQDLLADHYDAKNAVIRQVANVVAATRWPAEWLRRAESRNTSNQDKEQSRVAAVAVLAQPGLRDQAEKLFGVQAISDGETVLRKNGLFCTFVHCGLLLGQKL